MLSFHLSPHFLLCISLSRTTVAARFLKLCERWLASSFLRLSHSHLVVWLCRTIETHLCRSGRGLFAHQLRAWRICSAIRSQPVGPFHAVASQPKPTCIIASKDTVNVDRSSRNATLRPWSLGRQSSPSAQRLIRFIWHWKIRRRCIDAAIRLCLLTVRNFDPVETSYTRSSRSSSIVSLSSSSTLPFIRPAS